jgi:hypothetical protein
MNSGVDTTKTNERKAVLSALWIYLSVNYIYCDHLGILEAGMLKGLLTGYIGTIEVSQGFLIAAALLMQIPFVMIVLSRILNYKANRLANMIAAAIMIIVQLGTMGMGTSPTAVYIFYSIIEIACNLVIIWIAWKWVYRENVINA